MLTWLPLDLDVDRICRLVPSPGPATPASSGRLEISPPRGQLGSAKKQKMSSLSGEASKQDSAKSAASLPGSPVGAKPPTKGTKVPRVALLASKTAVPPGESKSAQKRNAKAAALATGPPLIHISFHKKHYIIKRSLLDAGGKMAGEKDRPSPKKAASGKPRSGGKSPALGSKIPKPAWSASPKASPRGDVHITAEVSPFLDVCLVCQNDVALCYAISQCSIIPSPDINPV